jgi:uncharacterized membrane protein
MLRLFQVSCSSVTLLGVRLMVEFHSMVVVTSLGITFGNVGVLLVYVGVTNLRGCWGSAPLYCRHYTFGNAEVLLLYCVVIIYLQECRGSAPIYCGYYLPSGMLGLCLYAV